ncbi:MAG: glycosyltransferase family 2 protein [Actinomycetota bacterium]
MTVSVVLLNWNGEKFLTGCLDSVFAQDYADLEIIVIDNASSDGSVPLLNERYGGRVTLVENAENTGFSRAMNQGFRLAKGEFIMPLNFDILLEPDFVSRMVEALTADARRGSVTGKLLRFNETGKTDIIDSTGHVIFKNRYVINRGEDRLDTGQFDAADLVFGATGAVPLYRRKMLDDIAWNGEYYDESFFIMLEDVDLDWRAQLRGWKCAYAPLAVAYHFRSASAVSKSRLIQRHYYKNRYLTIWKNDFWLSWLKHLPQITLMDIYLNTDIMFTSPIALVQAWGDLARLTPLTLKKRSFIKKNRRVARRDIEQWFRPYSWMSDVKRKLRLS